MSTTARSREGSSLAQRVIGGVIGGVVGGLVFGAMMAMMGSVSHTPGRGRRVALGCAFTVWPGTRSSR